MKKKEKEIEVRVLLKNRKVIESKVESLGGKIVYFSRLKDFWFCPRDVKNYQKASIDNTGFALRIRETKDIYTGKIISSLDCKTLCDDKTHAFCNEYEMDVADPDQMRKILESIGLKEFLVVDKERVIYKLKDVKYCFDKIVGVGDGLEIEKMTTANIQKTHRELIKRAKELGIKDKEILDKSLTFIAMQKLAKFK